MHGVFWSICGGRMVPRHHMTLWRPPVSGLGSIVITPLMISIGRDEGGGLDSFGAMLERQPDDGISVRIGFRFAAASIQSESWGAGRFDAAIISAASSNVGLLEASCSGCNRCALAIARSPRRLVSCA